MSVSCRCELRAAPSRTGGRARYWSTFSQLKMATSRGQVNGDSVSSPRKKQRTEIGSKVTVVLGAQWGDEGKGKVVDMLATNSDIVCRCQVSVHYQTCAFYPKHLKNNITQQPTPNSPIRNTNSEQKYTDLPVKPHRTLENTRKTNILT